MWLPMAVATLDARATLPVSSSGFGPTRVCEWVRMGGIAVLENVLRLDVKMYLKDVFFIFLISSKVTFYSCY